MSDCDVAVIGAGAAGLLAAARAGLRGHRVLVLEKNRQAGVKILMSGGTRCNLTHATDRRGIVEAFGPQGSFLHSALAAFGPEELVSLLAAEGVPTKVEEGGKVFPASDRAEDVRDCLLRLVRRAGVEMRLTTGVMELTRDAQAFLLSTTRGEVRAGKVILTTGGQSYPGCGTTGDGYRWARALGHTLVPPRPALVPLKCMVPWVRELSGMTLPDVLVRIVAGDTRRVAAQRQGSLLLTHFGLSGPVMLDVSRAVTEQPNGAWCAVCDFLPDLSREKLVERLAQLAATDGKRSVGSVVADWLPRRLAEALLIQAGIDGDGRIAELSKAARKTLVAAVKEQVLPLSGSLGFKKAEVTAGGIALGEVDSRTMQSKLIPGLFLAGEILDLDGPIGGYNFQAAFSTGYLAGESV
jgi:predicted Rossmann fold flavoprotein